MIYELAIDDFHKIDRLFQGLKHYIPVMAITSGSYPGKVFVDDLVTPNNAVVWGVGSWAYVEGVPHNRPFNNSLMNLFTNIIVPHTSRFSVYQFELYTPATLAWSQTIETSLYEFQPRKQERAILQFNSDRYLERRQPLSIPKGMHIDEIDVPVFPREFHDPQLVSEEIFNQTTFGFVLAKEDSILASCKCIGASYKQEFMLELETYHDDDSFEDFATMIAMAMADYCIEHEYQPVWSIETDDKFSQNLALKLGFTELGTYPLYTLQFTE